MNNPSKDTEKCRWSTKSVVRRQRGYFLCLYMIICTRLVGRETKLAQT